MHAQHRDKFYLVWSWNKLKVNFYLVKSGGFKRATKIHEERDCDAPFGCLWTWLGVPCRPLASRANKPKKRMQKWNQSCGCGQGDIPSTDEVLVFSSVNVLSPPEVWTPSIHALTLGVHAEDKRQEPQQQAATPPALRLPPPPSLCVPASRRVFTGHCDSGLGSQAVLSWLQGLNSTHFYFVLAAYLTGKAARNNWAYSPLIHWSFQNHFYRQGSHTARQNFWGHLLPHHHFTDKNKRPSVQAMEAQTSLPLPIKTKQNCCVWKAANIILHTQESN